MRNYLGETSKATIFKGKFSEPPPPGKEVVIVLGFDASYPPFTSINEAGEAEGFDIDVMEWIAKKYGWRLVFKKLSG